MKMLNCLIAFLLIASCQQKESEATIKKTPLIHSKIDSLNTEAEVQQFIRETDTNYKKFELRKIADFNRRYGRSTDHDSLIKILARKLKIDKSYYKADFDNNGFTDLVAIGDNYKCTTWDKNEQSVSCDFSVFALMNFGKDSILIKTLQSDYDRPLVPKITQVDCIPFLSVNTIKYDYDKKKKREIISDTSTVLAYKYDAFIEYQKKSKIHSIEKIEFSSSACFGTCPIFRIEIKDNQKAILWADEYNYSISHPKTRAEFKARKELKGKYEGLLTKDKYKQVIDLINYLNIESLKENYMAGGTCQPSSSLRITYDNGKVKTISDYGVNGTRGLNKLYGILFDLRFNQKWHLLSKKLDIDIY